MTHSLIPDEIVLHISSFAPTSSFGNIARCCRLWNHLCKDDGLWKERTENTWHPDDCLVNKFESQTWNQFYRNKHEQDIAWRKGRRNSERVSLAPGTESIAVSSEYIALGTHEGWLRVFSSHTLQLVFEIRLPAWVVCVSLSGDNVIAGCSDPHGTAYVYHIPSKQHICSSVHMGGILAAQIHDDLLVVGSADRTVSVTSINTQTRLGSMIGHSSAIYDMTLNPDGTRLATGSKDHEIRVWDVNTREELLLITEHERTVLSVKQDRLDPAFYVSGGRDRTAKLWDWNRPESVLTMHCPDLVNEVLCYGNLIVASCEDKCVRLYDKRSGSETAKFGYGNVPRLTKPSAISDGLALLPEADILSFGLEDAGLCLFDLRKTSVPTLVEFVDSKTHCIASNGKNVIASAGDNQLLRMRNDRC